MPLSTIQRLQHMANLVIHIFDQIFRKCKDAEIWISTLWWWCLWIVHPLFLFDFEFDFPLRVSNQGRSVLTSSLCYCRFFFCNWKLLKARDVSHAIHQVYCRVIWFIWKWDNSLKHIFYWKNTVKDQFVNQNTSLVNIPQNWIF